MTLEQLQDNCERVERLIRVAEQRANSIRIAFTYAVTDDQRARAAAALTAADNVREDLANDRDYWGRRLDACIAHNGPIGR